MNQKIYLERRKKLVERIQAQYPGQKGIVFFIGDFEQSGIRFTQESNLIYFTGFEEPGLVYALDLEARSDVYLPQFKTDRSVWSVSELHGATAEQLKQWGISQVNPLGDPFAGYALPLRASKDSLKKFLEDCAALARMGYKLFTPLHERYVQQHMIWDRLISWEPSIKDALVDISDSVGALRRKKSKEEIDLIFQAVDCTMAAHEAAAAMIEPDIHEYEVQATLEFIFTQSGARPAFPSIVASGKQGTILHYDANNRVIKPGELVVVDIGARIQNYCGDITRTYPASGVFTKRQRELYSIVLEVQQYIEEHARPGYWLSNKEHADRSLHHMAVAYFEKKGYARYFPHGIGHYLGIDVHDVGSYAEPLAEGDIITIEPGIYIPGESIGIRIEDNYVITDTGAACFSADLPKAPHEIEELMADSE